MLPTVTNPADSTHRCVPLFSHAISDVEQLFHDVVEIAVPLPGAEGVVQPPVKDVQLPIGLMSFRVGLEDARLEPGHGGLGGAEIRIGAGNHGPGNGGAKRTGLSRARYFHGTA